MFNIINLVRVTTLMDEAKKYPLNTVLTAEEQIKGRGKGDRIWNSQKSNNLYFSLNIETGVFENYYPFLTSLALLKALKEYDDKINLKLKWPNDLILNDKKMCGILLEKNENFIVIGIGVNIDFYPENTNFLATSLSAEGYNIDKNELLQKFLKHFSNLFKDINFLGFKNIRNEWLVNAYKLHEKIKVNRDGIEYIGIFEDISEDGALVLNTDNKILKFYSADIFNM